MLVLGRASLHLRPGAAPLTRSSVLLRRRTALATGLFAAGVAATAAAQGPSRPSPRGWGDELPAPTPAVAGVAHSAGALLPAPRLEWPAPPLEPPPHPVHAIYVNAWAFGSRRLYDLIQLVEGTEVNSFVIDVKDDTGYLTYRSDVPTAVSIGANTQLRAPDTRARLRALQARGIHPIARIVVAKDPLLAQQRTAWAIHDVRGGAWLDRQGRPWVDAYTDSVWEYAAALGVEAVRMGFDELQFDYVRFPDEPRARLATAVFPGRRGSENSEQGVTRSLHLLRERVKPLGVPFTIDVFGLTTSAEDDMGIGQKWESLVTSADVVLPMVYPSHYGRGSYGYDQPNAEPYAIIRRAMEDARRRSRAVHASTEIRPYIQAFTLGPPRYTPELVREQVRAAEDLGIMGWVMWNPRSDYDPAYFRSVPAPAESPPAPPVSSQ